MDQTSDLLGALLANPGFRQTVEQANTNLAAFVEELQTLRRYSARECEMLIQAILSHLQAEGAEDFATHVAGMPGIAEHRDLLPGLIILLLLGDHGWMDTPFLDSFGRFLARSALRRRPSTIPN